MKWTDKMKYKIKWKLNSLSRIPYCTYLCIRFPFLYPRNRFSGKHYTNWKIQDKIRELNKKYINDIEYYVDNEGNERLKFIPKKWKKWDKIKKYCWTILHEILEFFHCLPTSTELHALDKGWRKAFGIQICKEIKESLLRNYGWKSVFKYRIVQIKEKFGSLRWYDNNSPVEVQKIIHKYKEISRHTCIVCGKPATVQTQGWISPYCDDCKPEREVSFDFGHKGLSWYGYTGNINNRDHWEELKKRMGGI